MANNYWAIYTMRDGEGWQHEMDFTGDREEVNEELECWRKPGVKAKAVALSRAQWVSPSRAMLAEREHARRAA